MSMMSQGTWQPRPSMAQSRPNSTHPSHHRPSNSMYSTANRHSYFADPTQQQRGSVYSMGGSPLRPPQPAEMRKREIGEGDRISRVSFAGGERPSFSSSRVGGVGGGGGGGVSVYERKSLHQSQLSRSSNSPPQPQYSPPLNLTSSQSSSSLLSQSSRFEDPIVKISTESFVDVSTQSDLPGTTFSRYPWLVIIR